MANLSDGAGAAMDQDIEHAKENRIHFPGIKKPPAFFMDLALKLMQQYGEVELSASGISFMTLLTVSEDLTNKGFAVLKDIKTSTIDLVDEARGRTVRGTQTDVILKKSEQFDELMAATNDTKGTADQYEQ